MQLDEQLLKSYTLGIKKADLKILKYRLKRSVENDIINRDDFELKAA